MSTNESAYQVEFPEWYDERGEWEAESKGWLQGVTVRLANGVTYPLFFYDPVRLAQDLEIETRIGKPFIAERGMIVIPNVTRTAILAAVSHLVASDFFAGIDRMSQSASRNGIAVEAASNSPALT